MNIILASHSALHMWRMRPKHFEERRRTISNQFKQILNISEISSFIEREKLPSPLCLFVARKSERASKELLSCSYSSVVPALPCIIEIEQGVFLSSPEFTLLQLASTLDVVRLARVISEFCGTYTPSETGLIKRAPFTTLAKCKKFADSCNGYLAVEKFKQAIQLAVENSASPRETALALILSLPTKYGGYALPKPCMNFELPLKATAQRSLNRESLHVDLYWPENKLGVEYNSDEHHLDSNQSAYDSKRNNGLNYTGYNIVTVTTSQLNSLAEMNCVAEMLSTAMNKRIRISRKDFNVKQLELREILLGHTTQEEQQKKCCA